MKRILLTVTGTVLGVVALLSFKTHSQVATASGGLPSAGLSGTSSNAAAANPSPSTTGAPPDPTATKPASTKHSSPASKSTSPASLVYTGAAEQTRYGIVQVKITVSGKKITNVGFAQLTAFDGRSQQINSQAAPTLLQETLQAQSANINSVSGASYTSQGYVQSLQSALDKAGL
jgi:uncharacterized protein with FMN-binding domain